MKKDYVTEGVFVYDTNFEIMRFILSRLYRTMMLYKRLNLEIRKQSVNASPRI